MSRENMAQFILFNLRSNYSKPYGIQSMQSFHWEKCLWKRVDTLLSSDTTLTFFFFSQDLDEKIDATLCSKIPLPASLKLSKYCS